MTRNKPNKTATKKVIKALVTVTLTLSYLRDQYLLDQLYPEFRALLPQNAFAYWAVQTLSVLPISVLAGSIAVEGLEKIYKGIKAAPKAIEKQYNDTKEMVDEIKRLGFKQWVLHQASEIADNIVESIFDTLTLGAFNDLRKINFFDDSVKNKKEDNSWYSTLTSYLSFN